MSSKPLWERLGLKVPKNIGFVTSEDDLSIAYQLRNAAGHAVRVASYDDLLSRVWRSYSGEDTARVSELPVAEFVGGVDAYVFDGYPPAKRLKEIRELLATARRPSVYLPPLRVLEGPRLHKSVEEKLSSYNPSFSI